MPGKKKRGLGTGKSSVPIHKNPFGTMSPPAPSASASPRRDMATGTGEDVATADGDAQWQDSQA
eukprot:gene4039-2256_t